MEKKIKRKDFETEEDYYAFLKQKLEKFLGTTTEKLKQEIVHRAIRMSRETISVLVTISKSRTWSVAVHQIGSTDGQTGQNRFLYEFSTISPFDMADFESVQFDEDNEYYYDTETGEIYGNIDEFQDNAENYVMSGFYHPFEYEWHEFLKEFNEWVS